ncbi:MAG: hypothetical protein JWM44_2971 [Bacilli bacterium]|nr:hypothetical protein [Bacilli bacterium]
MNRLEEMKKLFLQNCEDWGRDDIEYLLQRLERYEKALNDVSEHCYSCGGDFVSPEKYCIKIVKEALKDNEIT